MSPGTSESTSTYSLPLQLVDVARLEGLLALTHVELRVLGDGALVHAKHRDLAHVRIHDHLEHVREHMLLRIGIGVELLAFGGRGFHERRRIALRRVRRELGEDIEEFLDAGPGSRGSEAHRDQMSFTQRLLEGRVQLLGRKLLALLEVDLHQLLVHLDHLVDQGGVRRLHRREIGIAIGIEEAVDDILAPMGGKVDRQALLAEHFLYPREKRLEVDVLRVDLVDQDHAVQVALARRAHHARRVELDAVLGVDHDHREVDAGERAIDCPAKSGMPGVSIRWTWMPL
jgi:hypothetical protein